MRVEQQNLNGRLLIGFVGILFLIAGCSSAADVATPSYTQDLQGAVIDPPRELVDFSMAATTGETFTLSQHRGEVLLIYFGYRSCPDFCPTTFAELRRVYTELNQPADRVKVMMITLDPERDTLENLALYTQAFHPDFIGLRDDGETLQAVMDQFGVIAERQPLADSPLSYLIDHTASVFLIDPDGRLLVQFLYGTNYREIVHDVNLILQAT